MTAPEQQVTWPPPAGARVTATGTCCGQTLAEIRFVSTGDPEQHVVVPGCPNSIRLPHKPRLTFTWIEDGVEWQAAPGQADLHQRIAETVSYCRDGCDFCEPDTVAAAVLAVVEPKLAALREQLAAAQAENERLRARLDDYGSPILGPVPVPPPDLGSIRMAEARNELERTGTTDKPWAAGRGLCPEKTGCPSGLLALFQLTKRGRLPVHYGEYGGPCDGSGKKPSVVLRYAATTSSV